MYFDYTIGKCHLLVDNLFHISIIKIKIKHSKKNKIRSLKYRSITLQSEKVQFISFNNSRPQYLPMHLSYSYLRNSVQFTKGETKVLLLIIITVNELCCIFIFQNYIVNLSYNLSARMNVNLGI
jgi:hypothetical protein